MDISLVIVALILVASVFVPLFFFNAAGKNELKKMRFKCKAAVAKNYLNVSQDESWGNTYLGIDTSQKKLFFLKILEPKNVEIILDLNRINGCKILEERKVIKTKGKKEAILEKLDLEVSLKNGERMILSFFDIDQKYRENFELLRIEKWKGIVLGHLTNTVIGKKVA